jgi:hypothetical protein
MISSAKHLLCTDLPPEIKIFLLSMCRYVFKIEIFPYDGPCPYGARPTIASGNLRVKRSSAASGLEKCIEDAAK